MDYIRNQSEAVQAFTRMSSIPQGSFAAKKCREFIDKNEKLDEHLGKYKNIMREDKSQYRNIQIKFSDISMILILNWNVGVVEVNIITTCVGTVLSSPNSFYSLKLF